MKKKRNNKHKREEAIGELVEKLGLSHEFRRKLTDSLEATLKGTIDPRLGSMIKEGVAGHLAKHGGTPDTISPDFRRSGEEIALIALLEQQCDSTRHANIIHGLALPEVQEGFRDLDLRMKPEDFVRLTDDIRNRLVKPYEVAKTTHRVLERMNKIDYVRQGVAALVPRMQEISGKLEGIDADFTPIGQAIGALKALARDVLALEASLKQKDVGAKGPSAAK